MNSKNIINSLKMGNVPQCDVFEFCVSRNAEINEFENLLEDISQNHSYVRFLDGEYGSGKSFLLKIIEEIALKNNFVISNINIMTNSNIRSVYRDMMNSLKSQNECSFKEIIDNWLDDFQSILIDDEQELFNQILHEELFNSIKFSNSFILALEYYNKFRNKNELEKSSSIISWLSGDTQISYSDNNFSEVVEFEFLEALSYFIRLAGYSGLVILIDDVENILAMDFNKQNIVYSRIKYLLDSCSLNKFKSSLFVFAGTPEWFEHQQKGIPSYESLDDMLKNVLDTNLADMRKPIFYLRGFDEKNLKEIAGKLTIMHEEVYNWKASDKINPVLDDIISIHLTDATLTGGKVTPRTFIRSFLSVLDTVQQNQSFFKDSNQIIELCVMGYNQNSEIDFEGIDEIDNDW